MAGSFEGGDKGKIIKFGEFRKERLGDESPHPERLVVPEEVAREIVGKGEPAKSEVPLPTVSEYGTDDMETFLRHYKMDSRQYAAAFIYAIASRYLSERERLSTDTVDK